MGVASGCGEQEVGVASGSGWNLWVWLLGVLVRRYIDFLILLIPTPLVSVLFAAATLLLFIFFKMFFVLYIIRPILCHDCEIWSFTKKEEIERIELQYLKYFLHLPNNATNLAVHGKFAQFPLHL